MSEFIENKPIGCNMCGYEPIYGQESTNNNKNQTIFECRWVCPRCGSLVRVDEKVVNEEKEED